MDSKRNGDVTNDNDTIDIELSDTVLPISSEIENFKWDAEDLMPTEDGQNFLVESACRADSAYRAGFFLSPRDGSGGRVPVWMKCVIESAYLRDSKIWSVISNLPASKSTARIVHRRGGFIGSNDENSDTLLLLPLTLGGNFVDWNMIPLHPNDEFVARYWHRLDRIIEAYVKIPECYVELQVRIFYDDEEHPERPTKISRSLRFMRRPKCDKKEQCIVLRQTIRTLIQSFLLEDDFTDVYGYAEFNEKIGKIIDESENLPLDKLVPLLRKVNVMWSVLYASSVTQDDEEDEEEAHDEPEYDEDETSDEIEEEEEEDEEEASDETDYEEEETDDEIEDGEEEDEDIFEETEDICRYVDILLNDGEPPTLNEVEFCAYDLKPPDGEGQTPNNIPPNSPFVDVRCRRAVGLDPNGLPLPDPSHYTASVPTWISAIIEGHHTRVFDIDEDSLMRKIHDNELSKRLMQVMHTRGGVELQKCNDFNCGYLVPVFLGGICVDWNLLPHSDGFCNSGVIRAVYKLIGRIIQAFVQRDGCRVELEIRLFYENDKLPDFPTRMCYSARFIRKKDDESNKEIDRLRGRFCRLFPYADAARKVPDLWELNAFDSQVINILASAKVDRKWSTIISSTLELYPLYRAIESAVEIKEKQIVDLGLTCVVDVQNGMVCRTEDWAAYNLESDLNSCSVVPNIDIHLPIVAAKMRNVSYNKTLWVSGKIELRHLSSARSHHTCGESRFDSHRGNTDRSLQCSGCRSLCMISPVLGVPDSYEWNRLNFTSLALRSFLKKMELIIKAYIQRTWCEVLVQVKINYDSDSMEPSSLLYSVQFLRSPNERNDEHIKIFLDGIRTVVNSICDEDSLGEHLKRHKRATSDRHVMARAKISDFFMISSKLFESIDTNGTDDWVVHYFSKLNNLWTPMKTSIEGCVRKRKFSFWDLVPVVGSIRTLKESYEDFKDGNETMGSINLAIGVVSAVSDVFLVTSLAGGIAKLGAKQAVKEGVKQTAKQSAQQLAKEGVIQAAQKSAKKVAATGAKQVTNAGAKQAAKASAKQAAKTAAKRAAKAAAKRAAKAAAKRVAKVAAERAAIKKVAKEGVKLAAKAGVKAAARAGVIQSVKEVLVQTAKEKVKRAGKEGEKIPAEEEAEDDAKGGVKQDANEDGKLAAELGAKQATKGGAKERVKQAVKEGVRQAAKVCVEQASKQGAKHAMNKVIPTSMERNICK